MDYDYIYPYQTTYEKAWPFRDISKFYLDGVELPYTTFQEELRNKIVTIEDLRLPCQAAMFLYNGGEPVIFEKTVEIAKLHSCSSSSRARVVPKYGDFFYGSTSIDNFYYQDIKIKSKSMPLLLTVLMDGQIGFVPDDPNMKTVTFIYGMVSHDKLNEMGATSRFKFQDLTYDSGSIIFPEDY